MHVFMVFNFSCLEFYRTFVCVPDLNVHVFMVFNFSVLEFYQVRFNQMLQQTIWIHFRHSSRAKAFSLRDTWKPCLVNLIFWRADSAYQIIQVDKSPVAIGGIRSFWKITSTFDWLREGSRNKDAWSVRSAG